MLIITAGSLLGIAGFIVGSIAVGIFLLLFPHGKKLVLGLLAFSACYVRKPFYSEVLYVQERMLDPGFGVRLADLFAFGLLIYLLLAVPARKLIWVPYNFTPWLLLILLGCISTVLSPEPLYGMFTLHKLVRAGIVYWVVVNSVRDIPDIKAVLAGLLGSIYLEAFFVLKDKYITGTVVHRSLGTFRHANSLAMYCNLVSPVLLAAFLSGSLSRRWSVLMGLAVALAGVCVFFTWSRAAIVLFPLTLGSVALILLLQRITWRRIVISAAGTAALIVLFFLALPRLIQRFQTAPPESLSTRIQLNSAANAMAADYALGVGPNQFYSTLARAEYYRFVAPQITSVPDPEVFKQSPLGKSLLGIVHNVYLLYASEFGWAGLAIFILHLLRFLFKNLALVLSRTATGIPGALLLGILSGTVVLHAQGLLEFGLAQSEILFTFFILMGIMVSIGRLPSTPPRNMHPI